MVDSSRGIELDYDCADRFSHIATEDFDGDGHLDLFFSNYGLSKRVTPLNHTRCRGRRSQSIVSQSRRAFVRGRVRRGGFKT